MYSEQPAKRGERLEDEHAENLSFASMARHPVWTWDDSHDGYFPVEPHSPVPTGWGQLFIAATFEISSELRFDGYLIGCEQFYAFVVFVENEEFGFNLNMPDWCISTAAEMCRRIGIKADYELFPMKYSSVVVRGNGENICGVMSLSQQRL